ncbi:MAG: hypothetical protein K0B81_09600, partial [Candidatus Cloacimonetes bacterium]|nr:hypothetical protein [Candidatus Cloacimonadota bacterium]
MFNRKQFVLVVLIGLIFVLSVNAAHSQFAGGDGSEENPFLVEDAEQLNYVREYPDAYFKQIDNIDLSGYAGGQGWEPIKYFTGTYLGSGFSISNLVINRPSLDDIGLFGNVVGATLGGIRLIDISIVGRDNTGSITGYSEESTLVLSYATGSVEGKGNVGGLIGLFEQGEIVESYAFTTVRGNLNVGGIIGYKDVGVIKNCYATGDVDGEKNIGGLLGSYDGGSIINCYATGKVKGKDNPGGLIGYGNGTVTKSYWDIETTGQQDSAGGQGRSTNEMTYPYDPGTYVDWDFVYRWVEDVNHFHKGYPYLLRAPCDTIPYPFLGSGTENDPYQIQSAIQLNLIRGYLNSHFQQTADIDLGVPPWTENQGWEPIGTFIGGHMIDCMFMGSFDGNGFSIHNLYINRPNEVFQGLFGAIYNSTLNNITLVNVNVTGYIAVGSLVGLNWWHGIVKNITSEGTVTGYETIGGIIGVSYGETLTEQCFSLVNVYGSGREVGEVGGISGLNQNHSIIRKCKSEGIVYGYRNIGGITGHNFSYSSVIKSYSTGIVIGDITVGGIVGFNNAYSLIENCYSSSQVYGNRYATGGLVGLNWFNSGVVNSYSSSIVIGDSNVGGLIGVQNVEATTTNSYWDIVTSGQEDSDGGTEAVTVDMVLDNTIYTNWDFADTWAMTDYTTYPYLQWQVEPEIHNYPPNGYHKVFQGREFYWESFPVLWNRDANGNQSGQDVLDPLTYHNHIEVWDEWDPYMHWDGDDWNYQYPVNFNSTRGYQITFGSEDTYELIVDAPNFLPQNE